MTVTGLKMTLRQLVRAAVLYCDAREGLVLELDTSNSAILELLLTIRKPIEVLKRRPRPLKKKTKGCVLYLHCLVWETKYAL